jgi:restriction endonuclease S subunit
VLPIPPLDEQKRLVDQTNVMLEETDRLKVVYQKKLNALASLKQSLLHQAFTSKL